jgi:phage baseplate assembly protein W
MVYNQTTTVHGSTPPKIIKDKLKSQIKNTYGLMFPLGKDTRTGGFFSKASNMKAVEAAIKQLLRTEPGERVMLPRYGCSLKKYLFQPLDEVTFESIKRQIQHSFNRYIVGANLISLRVEPLGPTGPSGGNSLRVTLLVGLKEEDLAQIEVEVIIE